MLAFGSYIGFVIVSLPPNWPTQLHEGRPHAGISITSSSSYTSVEQGRGTKHWVWKYGTKIIDGWGRNNRYGHMLVEVSVAYVGAR